MNNPATTTTTLEETFEKAYHLASDPKAAKWGLTLEQKGILYACYKKVKFGPCKGERPGRFDFTARQKYDAWQAAGTMSREEAMKRYISVVKTVAANELSSCQ